MKTSLVQLKKKFEEELEEDLELVRDEKFWKAVTEVEKKKNLKFGSLADLKLNLGVEKA